MGKYHLSSQAESDILSIWEYIAEDSIVAADGIVDRCTEIFELLSANPRAGRKQDQYRVGLRSFATGRYVIFYKNVPNGIEVYRVLHGARFLDDLL